MYMYVNIFYIPNQTVYMFAGFFIARKLRDIKGIKSMKN